MTFRKYEWTAFTEADLLGAGANNGTSLGHGDKFIMPGSATVTMSTWDNDYTMSGDNYYWNDVSADQYGQDAYVDGHYLGAKLYAESYHVLYGSDGRTYYLIEIEVEGYNAPGVGDDFFSFYGAVPPAGVELTVGQECNVSGSWLDYRCLTAGHAAPANTPPTFTNLPSDGIICIDENTTFVIDVNATDADHDTLTYEIVGGRDASFFEIDAHTGELKFIGAPDFENPISGGHSNTYDVTIKVSDGNGGHETKALWVKVKDVEENGVIKGRFTHDADGNDNEWNEDTHQWDEGIEGATIELLDLHGNVVATSVTDHYGNYSFDVPAGDYQVKFPTVDGKVFSEQDSANADEHFDSDADENGLTDVIHLPEGGVICDVDTGVKEKPVVGDCIVIEAEDMHEWGFQTAHGSNASGGEFVKLNCTWGQGELSTTFNGASGEYDIKIHAQDESDGQSSIWVQVNGHTVDCIVLNRDSDGYGSDHGYFSEFTLENIHLNAGDTLSLYAQGRHGEWVRIDKIELCKDGEKCPDGFTLEDFSGPAKGTVVGTQFDGFSVVAQRAGDHPNSENDAMIFDSAHPTGGDHDLGFKNLGNIIIISEDNDSHDPDDNAHGGSISFHFDNPSDVHDIKVLDIEEAGGTIDLFDASGALIKSVAIPAGGNNSIQTVKLDAVGVDKMVINLVGSGAVDDLCFKPGDPPQPGSISGRYFCDDDGDGTELNGTGLDVGVAGFTVVLLDAAGAPVLDENGAQITTTTGSDGSYSFTDLVAGDYGVQFVGTPPFKQFIAPDQGNDDTVDSDAVADGNGNASILGITVNAGEESTDNDAGVRDPKTSVISGKVFLDNNDNDVNDGGDTDLGGILVTLSNGDTAITQSDGTYTFTGLPAGTYTVSFPSEINGNELVNPNVGPDDTIDSDAVDNGDGTASTGPITLGAADVSENNDAGVRDPGTASVGDFVFFDADGDGQQGLTELGVGGVDVILTGAGDDGVFGTSDDTEETTTTAGDGSYLFDDLDAGDYQITFDGTTTGGLVFTTQGDALPDANGFDSDASQTTGTTDTFTLGAGEAERDVDAGLVDPKTSVISGKVFLDNNDNDVNDGGDTDLGGILVTLSNGDTAITQSDGTYTFTGLPAGTYTVSFPSEINGNELVNPNVGPDDTIDSDAVDNGDGTASTGPITLGAADVSENNDAGVRDPGTASVGDFVFFDADGDGQQGLTELGVGGVDVILTGAGDDGVFGTSDDTEETTTTAGDGSYLFDDLDAGDYQITFDGTTTGGLVFTTQGDALPDANGFDSDASQTTGTTDTFTLGAGEAERDVDAGLVDPKTSVISGKVFLDNNDNDVNDGGDTDLGGILVTLSNGDTAITQSDGTYTFTGLPAGTYTVSFPSEINGNELVNPNVGPDDTIDSDAVDNGDGTASTGPITLGAADVSENNDAGVRDPGTASVGDFVFFDADGDGQQGLTELGVGGVDVILTGAGDDGVFGTSDDTEETTTTAGDGSYLFDDLDAGDYQITFDGTTTGGLVFTTQGDALPDANGFDSDASQTTGTTDTFTLGAGEAERDVDAGLVDPKTSVISGKVFLDNNDNDVNDGGDTDLGGILVTLSNGDTAITQSDGTYTFTGLPAGTYTVSFPSEINGNELVNPNVGPDDTIDSDAVDNGDGTASTGPITLGAADVSENNDAGVRDPGTASVGDFVFFDADGDGQQGLTELGVGGVDVILTGAGDDGVFGTSDDTEETTTTAGDGSYLFDDLDAGDYQITFDGTTTGGLVFTTQGDALPDANGFDSDASQTTGTTDTFTLGAGEAERDVDAGLVDPGTGKIGDKVFIDADGNGQQDAGEAGLDDVEVTLFNAAGIAIATQMTMNGGLYLFENLAAGDYTVGFTEADTFDFTAANVGDDTTDSDADQVTGRTGTITIGVGGENLTVDAGFVAENNDPTPEDDIVMTCADELLTVNVLDNDIDADGNTLTITEVDGQAISENGSVTTAAGTIVSLIGGQLVIDGTNVQDYIDLDINQEALENISYTVDDGQGGTAQANVAVTFKGDANTLDSFYASFPTGGTYELDYALDQGAPFPDFAFDLRFLDTGDARLDGVLFEEAYCLDFATAVDTLGVNTGTFFGSQSAEALASFDTNTVSNANGLAGSENLDLINWIIAQDFEDQGYSGWEVQIAIWELADDFDSSQTNFAAFDNTDAAGVQEILDGALALTGAFDAGVDSFVPTTDGTVGLIVNPGSSDPENLQPFIVALDFETFDCIC